MASWPRAVYRLRHGERCRRAIAALVRTYAERLDSGDLEAVAELFAWATLRVDGFPEVRRGSAEVLDLYRSTVILMMAGPARST